MDRSLPTPQEIDQRVTPLRQQIDEMAESYYILQGGQLKLVYRLIIPQGLASMTNVVEMGEYRVVQTEIEVP
jgi:hypothetical protein